MFEDLSERQVADLTKVWEATAKAMHWRENALGAMMRALAGGCTPEHLAAVTGFDVQTVKRCYLSPARNSTAGTPPTATHPDKSSSTGDADRQSVRPTSAPA
jgi:hypothetical protein